jgi:hypothetical protein
MTDATAAASTATTPAAPAPPSTPAEAATKLATLRGDKAWGDKLLSSDKDTVAEFHTLSKLASQASDIDRVMSGEANLPDLNIEGNLSLAKIAGEIPALRAAGISDPTIRELLEGRESTPAELDAVKQLRAARHSDEAWLKKYLAGDHEAVRESRLISIVLMQAPA